MDGLNLNLTNIRMGLVFRNHDVIVLGEYTDLGEMGENDMGVISDFDNIYENLSMNKFAIVEVRREDDKIALKDISSYVVEIDGEDVDSIMEIYHDDAVEFFRIIKDLHENIVSDAWH